MAIHGTAIVDPAASVDASAEIGPHCIVGPGVRIGAGTRLMAHVYVDGETEIGRDNCFYPYSTVGVAPQDLKYQGEPSKTAIGDRNQIREFCTIHRGTAGGGSLTAIGSDNLLQAYAHVAHDCDVGSHCVLCHAATLGGHVTVQDYAWVGAHSGVHQYCRIGIHSFVGGFSVVTQDVLPFATVVSERETKTHGINATGLQRRGFLPDEIKALRRAFKILAQTQLNNDQALAKIAEELPASPHLERIRDFVRSSTRGFVP